MNLSAASARRADLLVPLVLLLVSFEARPAGAARTGLRSGPASVAAGEADEIVLPPLEQRALSMDQKMFQPLSCNDHLTSADVDCVPTSSNYAGTLSDLLAAAETAAGEQVVVPCGRCAVASTTDGSTLDLPAGLNVEGMLHFPPSANLTVVTPHVFVQGVLQMDPPDSALGNAVRVRLVGTDDQYLVPHEENAMACDALTGCNVGKKVIAVAGGRLDIRGLEDGACPSWAQLRRVLPPDAEAVDANGCQLGHDLVVGDGTFESAAVGTKPGGWFQHHGGGGFAVVRDAEDGNQHLQQLGRCCDFTGLGIDLDTACADPPSASNNDGRYRFSFRYRTHATQSGEEVYANHGPALQLWPFGHNVPGVCPPAIDGEWVTCVKDIDLPDFVASASSGATLVIAMHAHPSKNVDYDDVQFEALAQPYEIVVPDAKAAECWASRPNLNSEILVTNSKSSGGWQNQIVRPVQTAEPLVTIQSAEAATKLSFARTDSVQNPISMDDDPRMASEVAWLSRPLVFEAEGDGPADSTYDALHGGHLIILHTPNVAQHIEGVEIRNFGQQGILGRYPIHFHMSGSVAGSVVRKNVIRQSKQRCVVIHGSHDVLVEDNVSFDTYGHCYILEDGGEHDNTFRNNLGARTRNQGIGIGSTDHFASTIWITNPTNHFIDNVCAGSQHRGIWFELRDIRGASSALPENQDVNPRHLSLYTFRGNTAHSNNDAGMSTYAPGYCPPTEALFEGISSYHNSFGLFIHGTCRETVRDAFFGYNQEGVLYFGNFNDNSIHNSTFLGRCGQVGIKFSLEPRSSQVQVLSSSFIGYTEDCPGNALLIESIQPKSEYDMPILSDLSFDSTNAPAVGISGLFEGRNIFIEDRDGTMNPLGYQGFYVNNVPHMRSFIDSDLCDGTNFCKSTCLRRVMVDTGCCSNKHSYPPNDYQMMVTSKTDPSKTFLFDKYIRQSGLWYHANQFDVVLPLDDYSVHFLRVSDGLVMVPPVTLTFDDETNLDDPPACEHVTKDSFEFHCPEENPYLSSDGVTCSDTASPTSSPTISAAPTSASPTFPSGQKGAVVETWRNVPYNDENDRMMIASLKRLSAYPGSPDESGILENNMLETPSNQGNDYGLRLWTYLVVPATGRYHFYIASDDNGELRLSPNTNPSEAVLIASVSGWTNPREWFKYSTQKSIAIDLVQGEVRYLEAIMKEGGGGDNLAIGWESSDTGLSLNVVSTDYTVLGPPSPTISPAPTASEKSYYVACGGSHNCGGETAVAMASEQHEVRCCRDEALTGWTKNWRCPFNVWGESVLKALPDAPGDGCYHAETYESASEICKANNGRLCTKEELLGDCSRGTGCYHDKDLIWSSTPVPESPATCKAATQECNASSECCSGECFGDFTCA